MQRSSVSLLLRISAHADMSFYDVCTMLTIIGLDNIVHIDTLRLCTHNEHLLHTCVVHMMQRPNSILSDGMLCKSHVNLIGYDNTCIHRRQHMELNA